MGIKYLFLIWLLAPLIGLCQGKSEKCEVTIDNAQVSLVGNIFYLDMKINNSSEKAIDNIKFKVDYYSVYGEFICSRDYTWETNLLLKPIKSNSTTRYYRPCFISAKETIKKCKLHIKRIHFTDDTTCE